MGRIICERADQNLGACGEEAEGYRERFEREDQPNHWSYWKADRRVDGRFRLERLEGTAYNNTNRTGDEHTIPL